MAALELARIAGILPAFLVAPEPAGEPVAVSPDDLAAFTDSHALTIATRARLPVAAAEDAEIIAFRSPDDLREHVALVIGTLAAFGFSRYPLKGNDTYLFIILTTRMLPAIVVIIPVILMFRVVGLSGSYTGIILLYTAFNLAFTIWMMKSFFDELSLDVEDAARIDGSSDMKVFFKIALPQVVAGLAATFVFGLILTWNEFLFALLLSGPDTRTVPVAMNQAVSSGGRGTDWTLLAAIETLFLIPVFLVTFFLQNHLLRGVTFGTVKR